MRFISIYLTSMYEETAENMKKMALSHLFMKDDYQIILDY